jgi:integrase
MNCLRNEYPTKQFPNLQSHEHAGSLNTDQFRILLATVPSEPLRTMLIVAVCLGLRMRELTCLRWEDFAAGYSDVIVYKPKTAKYAIRPLCQELRQLVRRLRSISAESEWVFPSLLSHGKAPYRTEELRHRVRSIGKKVLIQNPITWHMLCTLHETLKANALNSEGLAMLRSSRDQGAQRRVTTEVQRQILLAVLPAGLDSYTSNAAQH